MALSAPSHIIECWFCGEEFNSYSVYVCPVCKTNMYSDPKYSEEELYEDDIEDDEEIEDDTDIDEDDGYDDTTNPPEAADELPF